MQKIEENFNPKVSIVIPVYNGVNFMREAIDSALNQTYQNIEVIVINDGSSDDTDKIAKSYGDRIRYFFKENGGVATALNLGIEKMEGEYFSWLSHDDIYSPKKIEQQIKIIKLNNDQDLIVACSFLFFKDDHKVIGSSPAFLSKFEMDKIHPLYFLFNGYIHGCALLINKSHFKRVGIFNEKLPSTQDFDLWFRLLRNAKIKFSSEKLVLSRSHSDQGSKANLISHIEECDRLWISMFKELTDEEMKGISGSIYSFYDNIINFLEENTSYKKCIIYAKRKKFDELRRMLVSFDFNKRDKLIKREINKYFNEVENIDLLVSFLKSDFNIPDTRKRIAFPVYGYWSDRGGMNRMISMLTKELSEKYKVYIFCTSSFMGGYEINKDVTFLQINSSGINTELLMCNLVLLLNIDVFINSHNCSIEAINILKSVNDLEVKTIAWNHEHYFLPYYNNSLISCCKNRNDIFGELDAVVWLTSFSANVYSLLQDNSATIHNFSTFENGKVPIAFKNNKQIISVARHNDQRKRLELLLKVFNKILFYCPDATLNVVGEYDLSMPVNGVNSIKNIGQLIKKINSDKKRVILSGWVNDIEKHYQDAVINVLCSYHEGFGLSLIEAAVHGLPSIVFDDYGFDDIIDDGINGYIIKDNDIDQMAYKISNLLNNEKDLNKFKNNALEINNKFIKEDIVKKWINLIDGILTISDKEDKNNFIQNNFISPILDKERFIKTIATEYEESIKRLIDSKNNQKISFLKNFSRSFLNGLKKIIPKKLKKIIKILISK